ncbi:MAG: hypothetical protein OJI67_14335 [Prosthecobacter sp.]|nr:hypothetical protein [Prosthecobacter sp.]
MKNELRAILPKTMEDPEVLGCGVVTFPTDDCLAIKRRTYRRQRRHFRSIRQRILNMQTLLAARGALTEAELKAKHDQGGGHAAPWLLAARLLAASSPSAHLLTWPLLWDVLRWYAHNRGYNANKQWSRAGEDEEDDAEKVTNARNLMKQFGSETMAETLTRFMFAPHPDYDPFSAEVKLPPFKTASRYKAQNAAFPRETVEREVRLILEAHQGHLPGCDADFIRCLLEDWRALPCPGLTLPLRYVGGLLFGQLIPRFENRIITECPFTQQKVPTRNTFEFLRYRWVSQIANIRVGTREEKGLRALTVDERQSLNNLMEERGYLTPGELKTAVREITACTLDNLETMLMHPDMQQALQLLPIQSGKEAFRMAWAGLSGKHRHRYGIQLMRGKSFTLESLMADLRQLGDESAASQIETTLKKSSEKKGKPDTKKEATLRTESFKFTSLSGRAPYSRDLMKQVVREVMAGFHPRRKSRINDPEGGEDKPADGCLVATSEMQEAALKKPLDQQTNNHLIRHRLLILERLTDDIAADPQLTQGLPIGQVVIEVNRDLREMSGMTAKEMAQDMGQRLANFKAVTEKLTKDLAETSHHDKISPSLIRKGRIAMDLGWVCPYTQGQPFDAIALATNQVDKDHIIPYSQRPSNSLDSLVITWPEVNRFKGNRTAYEFIEQEQGKAVPGRADLMIVSLAKYKAFVEALNTRQGHDDDQKRKRRRKEMLLLPKWEEKDSGFLPRDLTVTSQLVRLGAQMVRRTLADLDPADITSIPGSVTGTLRNGWHLLGCLTQANPQVKAEDGLGTKTKTEIRSITHLHHALDAIVLGLAAHYLPRDGAIWEMIVKRKHTEEEKAALVALGIFARDAEGKVHLKRGLPEGLAEQISARLAEKRVVQHLPKDMGGLKVEENTRRILSVKEGRVKLRQRSRDPKTQKIHIKDTEESTGKILGLESGKLQKQQGARVITDNYGVAILDRLPEDTPPRERFIIIPWHKVWTRLEELKQKNLGKPPTVLRNGCLISVPRGTFIGVWKIKSCKDKAAKGICLDLSTPDSIDCAKEDARLTTLTRDGIKLLSTTLTGQKM